MRYLLQRFSEASSWAGLASIGLLFGMPSGAVDLIVQLGVSAVGLAAYLIPERK